VAIFSYVGNYFYTHYFYKVLGAAYTFPVDIQLNQVPVFLYFITHAYFMTYFTLSTILIRLLRTSKTYSRMGSFGKGVCNVLLIFTMSVATAFMETFTIQSVPYYTHESKEFMYTVGSLFYGWYFYVAFPMFYLIDEKPGPSWTIWQTASNCLAGSMIILIFLDLTRLVLIAFDITKTSTVPFL
jgi:cycloeucalenol cycloisomerase